MSVLGDMTNSGSRASQVLGSDTKGRRGTAFIIEAMLLAVFLVACIAVFMQLMGLSGHLSHDSSQLNAAVRAAANTAEDFSRDPLSFEATQASDEGLDVTAVVWAQNVGGGSLYHANITVANAQGEVVYQLQTAKFVAAPVAASGGEANG